MQTTTAHQTTHSSQSRLSCRSRRQMRRPALVTALLAIVAASCAMLQGCGTTSPARGVEQPVPTALAGEWSVASVRLENETASVPSGVPTRVFIRFTPDPSGTGLTEVTGHAGVNRFFGTASVSPDGSTTIDGLGSTRMAGPPTLMAFENRLLAALRKVTSWRGDGAGLILSGPDTKIWLLPDIAR